MASKATKKQATICALLEGFMAMMAEQGLGDDPEYIAQRERISNAGDNLSEILRSEPNGYLTDTDIERIKAVLDAFQDRSFARDAFDATHPIAMSIMLLSDQLVYVRSGRKRMALENLLHEAENTMTYFDPEWTYDSLEATDAADIINELLG